MEVKAPWNGHSFKENHQKAGMYLNIPTPEKMTIKQLQTHRK